MGLVPSVGKCLLLLFLTVDAGKTTYASADDDFVVGSGCTASTCGASVSSSPATSELSAIMEYETITSSEGCLAQSGTVCKSGETCAFWTCAVLGSSTGKAVSGCSISGTPKGGLTSDSSTTYSGEWTGTNASSTGTCPWNGREVGRMDAGMTNPNGGNIPLAMEEECSEHGTGYEAFLSLGGNDISNGKLLVNCHNSADDATARVYFVCCIPGDCDSCVDPVVSSPGSTTTAAIATEEGSTTSSRTSVVVASSVGAVALLGAVFVVAGKLRGEHGSAEHDKLHKVLQQDEMPQL